MKNKTENDEFLSDLNKALFSSKKRPKDNSGKELEKLLKEIELITRPLPAKKKKKKKKTESGGWKKQLFLDNKPETALHCKMQLC